MVIICDEVVIINDVVIIISLIMKGSLQKRSFDAS